MPPKKQKESDAKQIINVNVRIGDKAIKKKKGKRRPRLPKKTSGIAEVGATGTQYLGQQTLPAAAPSIPFYSPAQYYPSLPPAFQQQAQPRNIAGLLEDVKQERTNLLEDIARETKSAAIKEVQRAQGAEQRGELARIGFQEPVPQAPSIMQKAIEPIQSFTQIKSGEPIIEEPEEENVFPFQDQPFLMIEDIKRKGRKAGIRNRPKEEIRMQREQEAMKQAEKEARKIEKQTIIEERRRKREERQAQKQPQEQSQEQPQEVKTTVIRKRKSKIPTLNLEEQGNLPKTTQEQFNLI